MLRIPGRRGRDLCDAGLRPSRRDILRVGSSGLFGLSLGSMLRLQDASARGISLDGEPSKTTGGPGWGKAKSIILVYLQGGPSHLDLWDPKVDVPDNVRSAFKPIDSVVPGLQLMETLPKLATVTDKLTMIRSMRLHPQRPVQPHGRDLSDDDRIYHRQGEPVRPARAAEPERLPELRLETSCVSSRATSRCSRS